MPWACVLGHLGMLPVNNAQTSLSETEGGRRAHFVFALAFAANKDSGAHSDTAPGAFWLAKMWKPWKPLWKLL